MTPEALRPGDAKASSARRSTRQPPGLIVHADDFGETVEITRGICAAIEGGVLTSTTIMANMPGTKDALPRVGSLAGRASFGVHLNLCEGQPLTRGATLVDEQGRFHRKRALFRRALSGGLSRSEVEAEITAQIALVRDAGVRISHIDGHKHLHQLPVVSAAVAAILPRFGIERVRITRLRRLGNIRAASSLVREILAVPAARTFHRAGLRSPFRTADLDALMALPAGEPASALLCDLHGAVELVCHPGTALADQEKPGSCDRHAELQFLLSTRFREHIDQSGLRLISYWDI